MRTLVVDDEVVNRMILQESLQQYGEVDTAEDGEQAIRAARLAMEQGKPYDLICLDIMMPGMDGHAALQSIRLIEKRYGAMLKRAKIVMTTALGDRGNVLNALQGQCDHYLVKPIDMPGFVEFLQNTQLIS